MRQNGLPPTPDTLHLGCSYYLHSSHHFLSTWGVVMLETNMYEIWRLTVHKFTVHCNSECIVHTTNCFFCCCFLFFMLDVKFPHTCMHLSLFSLPTIVIWNSNLFFGFYTSRQNEFQFILLANTLGCKWVIMYKWFRYYYANCPIGKNKGT